MAVACARGNPNRVRPYCDATLAADNAADMSAAAMKSELPPPAPALSLQNKLDQIAHDRDVLALQRELARQGLREGDRVRRAKDGTPGHVTIDRQESPPRIVVATEVGSREPFSLLHWQRG
jgi:hypothetical protein